MKHPNATQAQRNRRIRSQEAMHRSHRRSELIRLAPIQEDLKQLSSPPTGESAEPIFSSPPNEQGACFTADGPPNKSFSQ
ncbi:MAG: hypothetical protein H6974_05355 [Gammaproteobacteria bacterium]|nr:hypothetical protein [Gammaproteobacteria bacterium]